MTGRLSALWDKAVPVIAAVGVLVGALGLGYGLYEAHQVTAQGATNARILHTEKEDLTGVRSLLGFVAQEQAREAIQAQDGAQAEATAVQVIDQIEAELGAICSAVRCHGVPLSGVAPPATASTPAPARTGPSSPATTAPRRHRAKRARA